MGTGCVLIALALTSGVVPWEDAGHLASTAVVRPAPIEPDTASNGPLKVEPASFATPAPKLLPAPPAGVVWQADAGGYYWVRKPDGSYAGDQNRFVVTPHGVPVNPGELPRYSPPAMPAADVSAVRYRAVRTQYCTTGTCR